MEDMQFGGSICVYTGKKKTLEDIPTLRVASAFYGSAFVSTM